MFYGYVAFGYNSEDGASRDWDSAIIVQVRAPYVDSEFEVVSLMENIARKHYEKETSISRWAYGKCMLDALDDISADEWARGGVEIVVGPERAYLSSADYPL